MRGIDTKQDRLFSYISQEERIPQNHPLRTIRRMSDEVLESLSKRFDRLYSDTGRPSIPPEHLLQVLYSIRSERLLMEQLDYPALAGLFRWFAGLNMDDAIWDATVFTKNRDRLLEGDIADAFFDQVPALARERALLSDERFTVDGISIEAWAGQKSFQKKENSVEAPSEGNNPTLDFQGEKRSNATQESTTDPQARLYRKGPGKEAKLSFMGHVLMENRHGLAVDARLTTATGTAEREAAQEMVKALPDRRWKHPSLGADKGYDTNDFVKTLRNLKATPTLRRTRLIVPAPLIDAPHTMPATRSVNENANWSNRSLDG